MTWRTTICWMLALGVLLPPMASVRAQSSPPDEETSETVACDAPSLAAIRLEGCVAATCADDDRRASFEALSGLTLGQPVSASDVARAQRLLVATGFFHGVDATCQPGPEGLTVVLSVHNNWTIRDVDIEGNQHFYKSDIRKRVFLRRGAALDPRAGPLADELQRQKESIERLYARDGFAAAKVELVPKADEDGYVHLLIRIDEGPKNRVGRLVIEIDQKQTEGAPRGCPTPRRVDVRDAADLGRSDVYTEQVERKAQRRIRSMLYRLGFVTPEVELSYEPERPQLRIKVKVSVCYDIAIYERELSRAWGRGFERLTDEELYEQLPFGDSGAFDRHEAELGREALEQYHEGRGYPFADIRLDYRDYRTDVSEPGRSPDLLGAIHYYVSLEGVAEIRDIRITGTKAFDEGEVRSWMVSEPYDFFSDGGYLQIQQMLWDLGTIRERYADAGFLRMKFGGCTPDPDEERLYRRVLARGQRLVVEYGRGDACFWLVQDEGAESIYLYAAVEEGPRSVVGGVHVLGTETLSDAQARKVLALPRGHAFSPAVVEEAVRRLARAYELEGIYPVDIEVECLAQGPEIGRDACRWRDVVADEVSLLLQVKEGLHHTVGATVIRGNFRTVDSVILRDLPPAGSPFDPERLSEGQRRLRDLGIFDSLDARPVGLTDEEAPEAIGLIVNLEESRSRFIDLAIGFETLNRDEETMPAFVTQTLAGGLALADQRSEGTGDVPLFRLPDLLMVAEATYVDRNLLGFGKEMYLPLKYGLSTTEPNRIASFKPTYLDRRFFGSFLRFRSTPFVLYDRATDLLDKFQYGVEFEVSKQLTRSLYSSIEYQISQIQVRDPRVEDAQWGPFTLQNRVNPRLAFDRTDHPLNPAEGYYLSGSLSYINALETDGSLDNFLKYEVAAKFFLSPRKLFTIALFVRFGGSVTFDADDLPANERYQLGGNQGMRGFGDAAVGQYDQDGRLKRVSETSDGKIVFGPWLAGGDVVLNGSLELRFPIIRRLGLWGGTFLDWGGLEETITSFHGSSFRASAGLGIRWLIGGQIPMRLDYGIVLNRRCKGYTVDGACVAEDFGALHFGLLYTF